MGFLSRLFGPGLDDDSALDPKDKVAHELAKYAKERSATARVIRVSEFSASYSDKDVAELKSIALQKSLRVDYRNAAITYLVEIGRRSPPLAEFVFHWFAGDHSKPADSSSVNFESERLQRELAKHAWECLHAADLLPENTPESEAADKSQNQQLTAPKRQHVEKSETPIDPEAQIRGNIGIYNDVLQAGDYDYALEFFDMYLKRNMIGEFRPILLHELSRAYAGKGDSDRSLELLRDASELSPDNSEIQASLNEALGQTGKTEMTAEALNRKGMACFENKQFDQAVAYFERALDQEPDNLFLLSNLASSLAEAGHAERAVQILESVVKQAPNDSVHHRNYGVVLKMTGQLDEAIHEFSQALLFDPYNGDARLNVARALFEQGKLDEARLHCEELSVRGTVKLMRLADKLLKEIEQVEDTSD